MLRLKATKGHLTETDRAAVRYMVEEGVTAAKSARITYALELIEGTTYKLRATSRRRSDFGGARSRRHDDAGDHAMTGITIAEGLDRLRTLAEERRISAGELRFRVGKGWQCRIEMEGEIIAKIEETAVGAMAAVASAAMGADFREECWGTSVVMGVSRMDREAVGA